MDDSVEAKYYPDKNIVKSLLFIKELAKDSSVSISIPSLSITEISANLEKDTKRGFRLRFKITNRNQFPLNHTASWEVAAKTGKFILNFKSHLASISYPTVEAPISNFYTNGFDKNKDSYFRLIIPLKEEISYHYYIDSSKKLRSRDCLCVRYDEMELDLDIYKDRDNSNSYLVIDTSSKVTYEKFANHCFSTLVGFGYITGKFPQDEGYFFVYDEPDLNEPTGAFYTEFRDSIYSFYSPIDRNPHSRITIIERKLCDEIYPTLRRVSADEFSKLCNEIYTSTDFSSILLLILEASGSTLLVMPSGYSVALEGLTELIVEKNQDKVLPPIKDNNLSKKIRKAFYKIIDENSTKIGEDGVKTLKNRIEQINISTLSNQNKLIKPFEFLGFLLSDDDKEAIKHRNDFLHGKITLTFGDDLDKANKEIYYISLRLYTLLAVLILKSIGYDNKIINYPKLYEAYFNKKLPDEQYFRQL